MSDAAREKAWQGHRSDDHSADEVSFCRGWDAAMVFVAEPTATLSQKYEQLRDAVGNLACHQCGFRISDGHAWICMSCRPVRTLLAIPGRGEFSVDAESLPR